MLNIKTTLLSSAVSLSLLSFGTLSYAQGENSTTPASDNAPASTMHIGGYLELGGNLGISDLFKAKSEKDAFYGYQEQITAATPGGMSGGFGVSFKPSSTSLIDVGLEVASSSAKVTEELLDDDGASVSLPTGATNQDWGDLDTDVVVVKVTGERLWNPHFSSYLSLGVGMASYEINGTVDGKKYRFTPKYTNPAFSLGLGAKAYFGQGKGVYLSAGLSYTKIIQDELTIFVDDDDRIIKGGMGTLQAEIKLGYKF